LPSFAQAQLPESTILLSEFFEEIHTFDPANSSLTDVLDSPDLGPFGQHIEAIDSNTVAITSFSDLLFYDVSSQTTSLFTQLSFVPSELTRDGNGDLVAIGTSGVLRVDTQTGLETLIHDETFFSPGDGVVDSAGNIFVTEFFEGLGVVLPNGGFRPIGDFGTNEFSNVDIGIDGALYVATTTGGDFLRVDQSTGDATLLAAGAFDSIVDLEVTDDGNIFFAGSVDDNSGLFSLDVVSGNVNTLLLTDDLNDGFFSTLDIDVFSSTNRSALSAIPEPSSGSLLAMLGLGMVGGMRRRNIV